MSWWRQREIGLCEKALESMSEGFGDGLDMMVEGYVGVK